MKKPALLLLLACVCAALLAGCSNLAPAFTGLTASLVKLERDASGAVTATVRYASSLANAVGGVPVSRGIDAAELIAGRRLAIAVFDDGPADAMVVGVW